MQRKYFVLFAFSAAIAVSSPVLAQSMNQPGETGNPGADAMTYAQHQNYAGFSQNNPALQIDPSHMTREQKDMLLASGREKLARLQKQIAKTPDGSRRDQLIADAARIQSAMDDVKNAPTID